MCENGSMRFRGVPRALMISRLTLPSNVISKKKDAVTFLKKNMSRPPKVLDTETIGSKEGQVWPLNHSLITAARKEKAEHAYNV